MPSFSIIIPHYDIVVTRRDGSLTSGRPDKPHEIEIRAEVNFRVLCTLLYFVVRNMNLVVIQMIRTSIHRLIRDEKAY